jgi:lipoprotein-releasing system ATP-binding protein
MLKAVNIQKSYGALQVLRGISLEVNPGEIVSIVGASGAGKTTLLQILGTLDNPDSGTVMYNNVDVFNLPQRKLAAFRSRHIGFVFQFHQLLPEFTALENVVLAARIAGTSKAEATRNAHALIERLGMTDRASHKPSELSGGEQQRIAVCRALINKPDVVFADEPTGNLDSLNAETMHALFEGLRDDLGQTFVIVTHNTALAALADRMITMKDGNLL